MNEILNKKKVAALVRLLSSENEGEIIACARALRRICSLNDLGNLIEESDKASLAKKDMQYLYDAGYKDGLEQGKKEGYKVGLEEGRKTLYQRDLFGDVFDNSQEEIRILYCDERKMRLVKLKERDFVESCLYRTSFLKKALTPAQRKWLDEIYKKLGGT
jgi:flagellar biosynthesis/type III secretory pathway protein FliH